MKLISLIKCSYLQIHQSLESGQCIKLQLIQKVNGKGNVQGQEEASHLIHIIIKVILALHLIKCYVHVCHKLCFFLKIVILMAIFWADGENSPANITVSVTHLSSIQP